MNSTEADVELTLERPVGPGPLGEYIIELMARGLTVTIKPADEYVKQLESRRSQPEVDGGQEKQNEGQ